MAGKSNSFFIIFLCWKSQQGETSILSLANSIRAWLGLLPFGVLVLSGLWAFLCRWQVAIEWVKRWWTWIFVLLFLSSFSSCTCYESVVMSLQIWVFSSKKKTPKLLLSTATMLPFFLINPEFNICCHVSFVHMNLGTMSIPKSFGTFPRL